MKNHKEIEQQIWTALNKLRSDMSFSGFPNIKLLELIGTTHGQEKFAQILDSKELMRAIIKTDGDSGPC